MNLSANLSGARFMTVAMLGFAISDTAVKILNQSIPLFEILFLRGSLVVLAFAAFIYYKQPQMPKTGYEWKIIFARGLTECGVSFCFFTALAKISLTDATTILQLLPLVMTLATFFVFGERFGLPRLLAIIIGFIGVCCVVQPSLTGINFYHGYAFIAMLLLTSREMLTRLLPPQTSSLWTAFTLACCIFLMGAVGTIVTGDWISPSFAQFGLLTTTAACVFSSYIVSVMSMRIGEVSFVSGFRYTGILFVILLDVFVFRDPPDLLTYFGCTLIAAAGIYTIYRERLSKN